MIVNPQLFNYRLIIGSLVIIIIILGSYNYSSFVSLKNQELLTKQEKILVQSELSKMIDNYKIINVKNDRANLKLEGTKDKLNRIIDSIKVLPKNASLITHYEAKIKAINKSNAALLSLLSASKNESKTLKKQLESYNKTKNITNNTKEVISKKEPQEVSPTFLSSALISTTKIIPESTINIRNIKAQGVKKVTSKNRIISTRIASKANQLHVSFTIPKNEDIYSPDNKNVYIQILDSNNNVVGDKGSVNFGDRNLIYSKKAIINNENETIKISTLIKTNKKEPLIKGSYLVNVFHNATRVANTTINLK